jgi:alpha-galactosidase
VYRAIEVVVRRSALGGRSAAFVPGLATLLLVLAIPVGSARATLAPTPVPYMGSNTYYGVGGVFDEATIKSVAESLISIGLAQARHKIVWLDFGWATGRETATAT